MKLSKIKVGMELPSVSHLVTRKNISRYGRAVGGFNAVHDDEVFAEEKGFETVIAHGVMHLNYITQMLSDFAGHPDRVKMIDIKFGKPVYPSDTVTAKGRIAKVSKQDENLRIICEIWSENQYGQRVTYDGLAEIELPGENSFEGT